jgi:hypothetical protein
MVVVQQKKRVRTPLYLVAAKVRVVVAASPKTPLPSLQILSNSQIILLVLRKHPRRLLLTLPHNRVSGRDLRAFQNKKKKTSSKGRQKIQTTNNFTKGQNPSEARIPALLWWPC